MAPATGQVEAISPSTAARASMKRPEMGQAQQYMDPPPVCIAVMTPMTVPLKPPMLQSPIPNDANTSKLRVSSSSNPSALSRRLSVALPFEPYSFQLRVFQPVPPVVAPPVSPPAPIVVRPGPS